MAILYIIKPLTITIHQFIMDHNQLTCTVHSTPKIITHCSPVKIVETAIRKSFYAKIPIGKLKCLEHIHAFRRIGKLISDISIPSFTIFLTKHEVTIATRINQVHNTVRM